MTNKDMEIWLITIGEPVPLSGNQNARLIRTGQFAFWASSRAKITWWTSAFDHVNRKFVVEKDSDIRINANLQIRLFKGCGYNSNISLKRFIDQNLLAKKMLWNMREDAHKPDIIVCSVPPVELAAAAVKYGNENSIPVLLDLRDMWPDIFIDHAPASLRGVARLVLAPLFRQAKKAFLGASALIGITEEFVDWGVSKAGRARNSWDASFSFAYNTTPPAAPNAAQASAFWDKHGVRAGDGEFRICFIGTLNHQFDIPTVIKASGILRERGVKAQFVICGDGAKLADFKRLAEGNPDILFPGWVDAAAIYLLMRRSSIGLAPLPDRYDFLATINNKSVEYLSAGLPIISCPAKGTLFRFLAENKCGCSVKYGDATGLADIIADLVKAPAALSQMSANAAKAFENNFTAENVNSKMMRHLQLVTREFNAGRDEMHAQNGGGQ